MQRNRRRLLAAALAISIAMIGSLFAPSAVSAAGPYDGKTVISEGHLDLFYVVMDGDEPVLAVDDDTVAPSVIRDPDDVVLHVRPSVDGISAPQEVADGVPGFTEVDDEIFVLPQHWETGQIFAGYGYDTSSIPHSTTVTYELVDMDGPGNFATWVWIATNVFERLNSTLAESSFWSASSHGHMAWGFTEEGEYEVTMQVTVEHPEHSEPLVSEPATYTFWVGEELPSGENGDGNGNGNGGAPETDLSIEGLSHHYHAGGAVTLSAVQNPPTGEDYYHWFTRAAGESEWSVVPGAGSASYGFIARTEDDGMEVMVRLYDDEHDVIAESDPVTIVVDDHGNPPVEGPVISTTLAEEAGSLVISVDEGHDEVVLSDLELTSGADRYEAEGDMGGIRVTDTRSDNPGWAASGRLRSFVTIDGDTLGGSNLGWTPSVLESSAGQNVEAAGATEPLLSGGSGIGAWTPLASAGEGSGLGSAVLGADLRLEAPLTLAPGTYEGLLILTVI